MAEEQEELLFHDACVLDVDPDGIKKAIIDYAEETAASP